MAFRCDSQAEPVSFSTADLGLLPCDVSLNAVSFEEIAPFLSLGFPNEAVKISRFPPLEILRSGALVVTRVPSEEHGLGCTARMAQLYRQFGHFLAARKDTRGRCDELLVVCDNFLCNGSIQVYYIYQRGPREMGCH